MPGHPNDAALYSTTRTYIRVPSDLPSSWDWSKKGVLPPVRKQKSVTCWTFSGCNSVSAKYKIEFDGEDLQILSVQELIDCVRPGEKECYTSSHNVAFQYIIRNKGIRREADYPFVGRKQPCRRSNRDQVVCPIGSYTELDNGDEVSLLRAVYQQPVAACIYADKSFADLGPNDIYSWPHDDRIPLGAHSVLIVGYGDENGKKYWKIQNSWGEGWGDKGFGRIDRGSPSWLVRASYPNIH